MVVLGYCRFKATLKALWVSLLMMTLLALNVQGVGVEELFIDGSSRAVYLEPIENMVKVINIEDRSTFSGILISEDLEKTNIRKQLSYVSDVLPQFKNIIDSPNQYFYRSGNEIGKIIFTSYTENRKTKLEIKGELKTALDLNAYFAQVGNTGIIEMGNAMKDKNQFFATLFHESIHAIQHSINSNQGKLYDLFNDDISEFSLYDLGGALNWVEREIEAHSLTAKMIENLLKLPLEQKDYRLEQMGLTVPGLNKARHEELVRLKIYKEKENELINEIVKYQNSPYD